MSRVRAAPAAALRRTREVLRIINLLAVVCPPRAGIDGSPPYETFWAAVRLVSSVRENIPARANTRPETQRGGREAAPLGFTAGLSGQFGTARLASGGKAALVVVPRSRSTAILSALSSFGSGGI